VYEKPRHLSPGAGLFLFVDARGHDLVMIALADSLATTDVFGVAIEDSEHFLLLPHTISPQSR
jgi:flagellar biosynthesis protein FliR